MRSKVEGAKRYGREGVRCGAAEEQRGRGMEEHSPLRSSAPLLLRSSAPHLLGVSPFRPLALVLSLILVTLLASGCRRGAEQSLARAVEAWDSGNYTLAADEYERYLQRDPAS